MQVSRLIAAREKIIAGIGTPLGFFVLALLIVELFILGAGLAFNLPVETRTTALWVGVGLFVLVILIVAILVIRFPQNLVFSEKSHIEMASIYGAKSNPISVSAVESLPAVEAPVQNSNDQVKQLSSKDEGTHD